MVEACVRAVQPAVAVTIAVAFDAKSVPEWVRGPAALLCVGVSARRVVDMPPWGGG